MKQHTKHNAEFFWPRLVMRKWLNLSSKESDYSADSDDDADSDAEEGLARWSNKPSRFRDNGGEDAEFDPNDISDAFPRLRRRNSETFRSQYINAKEIRICVGTWNVGGKLPPDDVDIDDWLDTEEPADIYVLGLQEIVPLNAGNIFGSEDRGPAVKWENIIRETLNRIQLLKSKIKSFSDPPSPSKFKPFDDIPNIEEEILLESDSEDGEELYDIGEEVHPLNEESKDIKEGQDQTLACENANLNFGTPNLIDRVMVDMEDEHNLKRQVSSLKRLDRLNCLRTDACSEETEESIAQLNVKLTKMHSSSESVSLSWPEPPLDMVSQHALDKQNYFRQNKSFKSSKSFKTYKSFRANSSFKSTANDMSSEIALLADIDLEALMKRKRRSQYVRIVSKQMVGIFLTIWVRRSLRRHIQNLKVSTVGVGIMGYIGNKGSVSVSMSIYQTPFCFICTHLTSGEKSGDELKRNADVHEIHRRTHFHSLSGIGLPRNIHDHERIIWLGDLNYRINLPFEQTRELIFKKEWPKLVESDQLVREFKKGRAFDGWSEGTLNFPPTYKYEINSEKYFGEDPKAGRRTPAWCDRILSYGNGIRQLSYRRSELKFSDHRPVTATYMAEVEVFSSRKLQRALTFTDAEVENEGVLANMDAEVGMSHLKIEQDFFEWER